MTTEETTTEETPGATFRCDICGRSFTSNAGLVIHKGRAHNGAKSDNDDGKLLKILFPDGNVPTSKWAEVNAWLEQTKKLRESK